MKRRYYLLFLLAVLAISSCKKFLDTKPTDFLNPDNYYQTEAQLEYARAGVYHDLEFFGRNGLWAMNWQGEESYMNMAVRLVTGPWNYFYTPTDQYITELWQRMFRGIERANVLLENVDKNKSISQQKRDAIRGEALFLRGFYYFTLAQNYGGVPLKTKATVSIVDVDIPRATLKEVYQQIIADMEAAEQLVPDITVVGYSGGISKSAARGMLARVNLHMAGEPLNDKSRYVEASKWAKKVMDDALAGHELNPNYAQVFINVAQDKYDIKESIWEVEFTGNRTDAFRETGWVGMSVGPVSANTATGRTDSRLSITSTFYDSYTAGDNRKWWNIAHFAYSATGVSGTKTMSALPANQNAKNLLRPAKYRREYETLLPKTNTETPQNMTMLRFSDVLLMYAEAENEIHGVPTPEAIEAVNLVRRRAWSTGIKAITITAAGTGYTSVPTISFVGTGTETATAKATISTSARTVTGIALDRDATGVKFFNEGSYSTVPTVVITGGGGTGARATVTVYSKTDAELTSTQTSSKLNFMNVIKEERMRELNCEGLRKGDLIRWGDFLKMNVDMASKLETESPGQYFIKSFSNASSRDLLFPIPNNETTTNLLIKQNPGWN
ncbi:MAG: RagB/SusD family nutrient uptake outer membrane protein [Pedobacter sp.]|nr:MAG: RagB/SusD family nutrient uptake outer membrane protein [Pedobacter sp.]